MIEVIKNFLVGAIVMVGLYAGYVIVHATGLAREILLAIVLIVAACVIGSLVRDSLK